MVIRRLSYIPKRRHLMLDLIQQVYNKMGFICRTVSFKADRRLLQNELVLTLVGKNKKAGEPDNVREFTLLLSLDRQDKKIHVDQWDMYFQDLTKPIKALLDYPELWDWLLAQGARSYENVYKDGRYKIVSYWGDEPSLIGDPIPVRDTDTRYW
jgi:hypothetical protein